MTELTREKQGKAGKVNRTKRFWGKVKGNDMRGGAYSGYTRRPALPSHAEMDEMDRYGLIYDIDPEIRSAVIDLNRNGFRTEGSCAGHIKGEPGFIMIRGNLARLTPERNARLTAILKKYEFRKVTIRPFNGTDNIAINFAPRAVHGWDDLTPMGKKRVKKVHGVTNREELNRVLQMR